MDLIEALKWRYATKRMNPLKAVPEVKVARIVEAARLAPTSSGLQPFEIVIITNSALREKIKSISMGQQQVTECSHLLIFAAWDDYTTERINQTFDYVNQERGSKNEGLESYRDMLLNTYPLRGAEVNFQHASKQAYIGLAAALLEAACQYVDCTPMEGFDPAALDEILGLRSRGLRSVLMMPLGYRDGESDWLLNLKKIRRPLDEFVSEIH